MTAPQDILKKYWGYNSFRPLQREIVDSVLSGHDTLGLLPTGGGKSITFQVPGIILDGISLIVSPLISLMKDQVDNLRKRRIEAVYFHSAMSAGETRRAWERIMNHKAKFIYVAPERLKNKRFLAELRNLNISLLVVDEAHCISQWGYDFRPSYLNIKEVRKIFTSIPVLALTATATPQVAGDICRELDFRENSNFFKMSFARDNISYIVRPADSKIHELLHILTHTSGSAIVYVRSRRRTQEIAQYLIANAIPATFYHAGLSFDIKEERQNLWKSDKIRVMVATNAFGMGIDKPDVRVVVHMDIPPSLEEYYQEAGRAGRDRLPSYAVLLTAVTDKSLLRRRITETFPPREDITRTYERACTFIGLAIGEGFDTVHEFDFDRFCDTFKIHPRLAKSSLHLLDQAGYLHFEEEAENKSRVLFSVDRDELYNIRLSNPVSDKVILSLLRNYPGLFSDYVFINEERIARDTNLSTQVVYQTLIELSKNKILKYIPRKRTPIIYVPTAREERRYLAIGKNIYENRREILTVRTEAMLSYAFGNKDCRVADMLRYFGEEDSRACGTCDICRKRKVKSAENSRNRSREELQTHILQYIENFPHGISRLKLAQCFNLKEDELREPVNFLLDEEFIFTDSDLLISSSNRKKYFAYRNR
ncbi:MAG: RecQ family ATP-dependent DNA helicase [Muribaculaceae bacterium]|nr:RecQ family ATP-dependent DNA helicase [Muribaculaceae bacterium]